MTNRPGGIVRRITGMAHLRMVNRPRGSSATISFGAFASCLVPRLRLGTRCLAGSACSEESEAEPRAQHITQAEPGNEIQPSRLAGSVTSRTAGLICRDEL